ncbi:enoyl-CoA hydratase [Rhodococcus jostii]|uniref:Short chain enoyl-CoA hydratase n=1 Tax=Rhodococcus jostii TaxID=132919 RepID=A0A1H5H892_RHOJO|nr:enoyl-CoA hydratase [Rhodococcus jostii]SEE24203.1 short chain enoyl-CoA hydratase [Rhodococcus jostii]
MTDQLVRCETHDRTAVLTLDRPESRNALNGPVLQQLTTAMAAADQDDAVDAIVLTGADPAFCAGIDLKAVAAQDPHLLRLVGAASHAPWPATAKPVIGAINGSAVTGGLEVALHCDFLIASERATFADTHARVGVLPCWGLTVLLPAAVGRRTAMRMSMTGEPLDAAAAHAAGLVTQVVAHDDLIPAALSAGAQISRSHALAARTLLASYRRADRAIRDAGYDVESHTAQNWNTIAHAGATRRPATPG